MNNLPKCWVVKNTFNDKFRIILEYIRDKYNKEFEGTFNYYGVNRETNDIIRKDSSNAFSYNYTILSIEEFIILSKEIEELPEEYIVECSSKEETNEVYCKMCGDDEGFNYWKYIIVYKEFNWNTSHIYNYIPKKLSYLPVYQFSLWKQLINNKQINNTMEKKIIGYKLIKPEYKIASEQIMNTCYAINNNEVTVPKCIDALKKAKVLDLWFEPIYEPTTPDITINNYKGEFFDDYVKFGCAEINKEIFIKLYEMNNLYVNRYNRQVEAVIIGKGEFSKEQIKEIAAYYLEKR